MSARVTISDLKEQSQPAWLGTKIVDPKVTLPGGVKLDFTGIALTDGKKYLPSGTVLGRTFAERDAWVALGRAAAGDEQIVILLHDVWDYMDGDLTAVVIGDKSNIVYHNYLAGWNSLAAAVKTLVYQNFVTVRGLE